MMRRERIYDWHWPKGSHWEVTGSVARCAQRPASAAAGKGQGGQQPYQIRRVAPRRNQTLDFE
jgi:hypothetical protein